MRREMALCGGAAAQQGIGLATTRYGKQNPMEQVNGNGARITNVAGSGDRLGEFSLASVLSRDEHLTACKTRALSVARAGRLAEAMTVFLTGMGRHPETSRHESLHRGLEMFESRELTTVEAMERYLATVQ